MHNDETDHRLQARFQELREQQARRTPAFNRVWGAAARREVRVLELWWLRPVAAAALLVIVTAVAMFCLKTKSTTADTSQWALLSNWQASTDVLLTVASTPWGSQITTPSDVLMDTSVSGSETTQQNEKETL